jgi:hypothetical protein
MYTAASAARDKKILSEERVRTIPCKKVRNENGVRVSSRHKQTVSLVPRYSGVSLQDPGLAR